MRMRKLVVCLTLFTVCLAGSAFGAETGKPAAVDLIRVACVGNSITHGAGIRGRGNNSHPAQIGGLLTGIQCPPNGNIVVCNYVGHGRSRKGAVSFEVTRDKKAVWQYTRPRDGPCSPGRPTA